MNQDYLIHYGVKGMRWGHRRNNRASRVKRKVRKSTKTKTFEKIAKASNSKAVLQKNLGNKASGDRWAQEAKQARQLAKESYEYDKWKANASRKDRKNLEKAQKEWDDNVRKNYVDTFNKASEVINKTITKKYNNILAKEKLAGEKYWEETKKDPVKMKRYNEIFKEYEAESVKMRKQIFDEEFGRRPTWKDYQK